MKLFKKGDSVGWRSDTEFTKSNKEIPAMTVVDARKTKDGYEYKVTGNIGWVSEHELEIR